METQTATDFTATVTRYFRVGPRTRRYRNGLDLHAEIVEAVRMAATLPGYYTEGTEQGLRQAFAAVCGYEKHIAGHRIDGRIIAKVNALSPYRFAQMLAAMVDDGVSSAYEAERFFKAL